MTQIINTLLIAQLIISIVVLSVAVGYFVRAIFSGDPVAALLFSGLALVACKFLFTPSLKNLKNLKKLHRQQP
ncbi:MAG: hypothetical protein NC212_08680 [Staphylococcus sp.]|nr:hypothetical protein [Staphylococcus sp.]